MGLFNSVFKFESESESSLRDNKAMENVKKAYEKDIFKHQSYTGFVKKLEQCIAEKNLYIKKVKNYNLETSPYSEEEYKQMIYKRNAIIEIFASKELSYGDDDLIDELFNVVGR